MITIPPKLLPVLSLSIGLAACGGGSNSSSNTSSHPGTGTGSEPLTKESAYRLLLQTTFGPTKAELERLTAIGAQAWLDEQFAKPSAYDDAGDSHQSHLQRTIEIAQTAEPTTDWYSDPAVFNQIAANSVDDYQLSTWWENALGTHPTKTRHGSDQLRQRVAYALSQILVVSKTEDPLDKRGEALAAYYDLLAKHAFGNFRELLGDISRSPAMGIFLSHQGNRKADPTKGTRPDENFARELMQLFTIGLYQLNKDGSPNRDGNPDSYPDAGSNLVTSYEQQDVEELAKIMTGWDLVGNKRYGEVKKTRGDYVSPMEFTPDEHEDEMAEGGDGQVSLLGRTIDLNAGNDGSGLDAALDVLFQHPNTGPFISRHLIMRLVTSNPSSGYIARVAEVFADNGQGVRGDLKAVLKAILLDAEARDPVQAAQDHFGKAKEPLLAWTQLLRAFDAKPLDGWSSKTGHPVNGVFWNRYLESTLQQGPMRSLSVFNFYSPDFVPSDSYFANNQLVSPEMQIQTDQAMLTFSNLVYDLVVSREKNSIELIPRSLAEQGARNNFGNKLLLYINFDTEYALFEQALDGDSNGDFANMEETDPADGVRYKEKAVDALLEHLDTLLLGDTMTDEYRAAMKEGLMNSSNLARSDDVLEARNIIRTAVRMIATSSAYMIQK